MRAEDAELEDPSPHPRCAAAGPPPAAGVSCASSIAPPPPPATTAGGKLINSPARSCMRRRDPHPSSVAAAPPPRRGVVVAPPPGGPQSSSGSSAVRFNRLLEELVVSFSRRIIVSDYSIQKTRSGYVNSTAVPPPATPALTVREQLMRCCSYISATITSLQRSLHPPVFVNVLVFSPSGGRLAHTERRLRHRRVRSRAPRFPHGRLRRRSVAAPRSRRRRPFRRR